VQQEEWIDPNSNFPVQSSVDKVVKAPQATAVGCSNAKGITRGRKFHLWSGGTPWERDYLRGRAQRTKGFWQLKFRGYVLPGTRSMRKGEEETSFITLSTKYLRMEKYFWNHWQMASALQEVSSHKWFWSICCNGRPEIWVWLLNTPKGPWIEDLVTSLWHYWVVVEPSKGGTWWEEVTTLMVFLEGCY
jgi:hypothetical protein